MTIAGEALQGIKLNQIHRMKRLIISKCDIYSAEGAWESQVMVALSQHETIESIVPSH